MTDKTVYFDDECNIQFQSKEERSETQNLYQNCHTFIQNVTDLDSQVSKFLTEIQSLNQSIENQKLKATGLKIKLNEIQNNQSNLKLKNQLSQNLQEKKTELDQLIVNNKLFFYLL